MPKGIYIRSEKNINHIRELGKKNKGKPSWGKGLTKETDIRVANVANALRGRPNSRKGKKLEEYAKDPITTRQRMKQAKSAAHKEKISSALKGHEFSETHRKNLCKENSKRQNWTPWNKNKHGYFPEETKRRIGAPHWKGGRKIADKRHSAKRRLLGHDFINMEFEGSTGHHIDKEHVIFIPKELHKSVYHEQKRPKTMERINTKVFCWLLGINY